MRYTGLLEYNIKVNGFKALVYCFGLSSSRYVEYAAAFESLKLSRGARMLDIGSGHSIFPSILQDMGYGVSLVDNTRSSLVWQKKKADNSERCARQFDVTLSSGERLPFRDNIFSCVTAISVIEHVPNDEHMAREIGRVLKTGGFCILSVPATPNDETVTTTDWTSGIPSYYKKWLRSIISVTFKKLNVDRGQKYLIREYSLKDVFKKIVEPSGCLLEELIPFENVVAKIIYRSVFPTSVFTPLELLLANFTNVGNSAKNVGGFILKMKKPQQQISMTKRGE